ncbi:MAG: SDR family NAD(P)-dependent oxidoreductase [Deltaproteobacteria bacterium]|nr:SDR family NAD(P)-dependent oxidoreductase [Deltaproteobacteria bacterium]
MKDLHGKVGVVTGGAGGIGRAIGEAMLAEGMQVVLADVVADQLAATVKELGGKDVMGLATDVTSFESLCALRDAALARFGAVHVVCNNAAVGAGAKGHVWEHHLNDWKWSLDVNVMGVINGMNAFVPMLIAQDEGHVVNTSSGNGAYFPIASSGIYPVTKAAVTTLTECLWGQLRQLGSKVSASCLLPSSPNPGVLATGIWKAGANRPDRFLRGDPDDNKPRDALADYRARAKAAGQEVPIAPLSDVADLCIRAIREDQFWATYPLENQTQKLRARFESMLNRTTPEYLNEVNLMAAGAKERAKS